MQRQVVILGSTGSIGCSTLDVIAQHPERFNVFALTAGRQIDKLFSQCLQAKPLYAAVLEASDAQLLQHKLRDAGSATQVLYGAQAFADLAAHQQTDIVMAAIVGAAGLLPTLAAVKQGKTVLLANKEALVMSGELFINAVQQHQATLLPIDSEHNAIFQCLPYDKSMDEAGVSRLILTASGGPFREFSLDAMRTVTPQQACAHPNWSMGQKISVDSATMMNKGLELIEACHLFGVAQECVDIVVHPQSIVHSMVEYRDGSTLAQMGNPDMRTPIAYGLAWPERIDAGVQRLSFASAMRLDFLPPDTVRFPALRLAREALKANGSAPAVLNAANEIAVAAFLAGRLPFTGIAAVVEQVLTELAAQVAPSDICALLEVDEQARVVAEREVKRRG